MWYILIIACILLTVTAYIKWRSASRRRRRTDESIVDRWLGQEVSVFFAGALALLFIALSILFSDPGMKELRSLRQQRDAAWHHLVAKQLAEQLRDSLPAEAKVLLIDQRPIDNSDPYHEAIKKGLEAGFNGQATITAEVYVEPVQSVQPEALPIANEALAPSSRQFAQWLSENQTCNVVISFVGIPADYAQSMMSYRAQNGDLVVGIYTGNVYQLGRAISQKSLHACVVPKYSYVDEELPPDLSQSAQAFDNRYLMITPENVGDIYKANRRMFKVQRAVIH